MKLFRTKKDRAFEYLLGDERRTERNRRREAAKKVFLKNADARDVYILYRTIPGIMSGKEVTELVSERDEDGSISFRLAERSNGRDGIDCDQLRMALMQKNPKSPYLQEWGMKVFASSLFATGRKEENNGSI